MPTTPDNTLGTSGKSICCIPLNLGVTQSGSGSQTRAKACNVRQSNVEVAQNESFVSALLWVEIK